MTYTSNDWNNALHACDEADWDEIDIRETGGPLSVALFEAYESDKVGQDTSILEAAIVAARTRYHGVFDTQQFESVWSNYVEAMTGWAGVAEQYLDEEYPGLLATHISHIDLEGIGRDYVKDRESEQYITIPDDPMVYVFNKLN